MNANKFYLLIGIALVLGLLPQGNVSADASFSRTMTFEFVQELPGPTLTMTSWSLINCQNSGCANTGKIIPFDTCKTLPCYKGGFQSVRSFACAENKCNAQYDYIDYKYDQLLIKFSDGVTRKSNVFKHTRFFDARYKVTVKNDSLLVKELKGSNINNGNLYFIFMFSAIYFPLAIGVVFIAIVCLVVYSAVKKEDPKLLSRRIGKVFWWTLIFTFIILGLLLSTNTFIATMVIELIVAWAILKYFKASGKKILYGVFIANVFTQPLFVIASTTVFSSFINALFLETIVWLVEGWIVNKTQENQLPLKNIFILTFILNAASFGIGLLLPI